jgi:uncharacterized membrane protein YkoI
MRVRRILAIGILTALSVGRLAAQEREREEQGQERKITRQELPAAVARAVTEHSKGGTIIGFSEEKEAGRTFYEMELRINGRTRDVTMDSSGAVVMVEEEVVLSELSAAVQAGLQKAAAAGRITLVESIARGGRVVAYEAHVETGGKESEIKVDPDGNVIAEP